MLVLYIHDPLFQSALVMYDRQTASLWTHFDGRAVIGTLVGTEPDRIPVATVPWSEFRRQRPDGEVLSTDTGHDRAYGRNPLDGPDDPREYRRRGDEFVDRETGSTWNLLGEAVAGPMTGHRLEAAIRLDTSWFAWSSYLPDTRLVARPGRTG